MNGLNGTTAAQRVDAAFAAMKMHERLRAATIMAAPHLDTRAIEIVRELKNDRVDIRRVEALIDDILARPPAGMTERELSNLRSRARDIAGALDPCPRRAQT